ncbi:acyl-CoA dehydrogenase family protein [Siccirubricoccus sp. KC 17139]|uniref:Acyl-CoA dehydrogenase family protein n=1 Tax=Siccirubricoccus soli TaxID=2899147 RepID=A0ABT1D912_9PROT|nr:acyl-CoA dehydrogenase family protein [Siccirubricoccus soli]MCO6417674.1 acyl-CoA dehydrogenase family protein [Siccirubricoccus soli]MCP2683809.1 acyl-CoA dehydrogenase family protein [Siccirubricoccus soli]
MHSSSLLAAARRLAPLVRAAAPEAERLRRCPPDLAQALTEAGLFQLYLPRALGGPELAPLEAFEVVEEISRADGSVGWCLMLAAAMSLNVARLPLEAGRELAGTPADYRGAGSARSGGRAVAVPGGYRVTGRWNFASGIDHARWLYATCTEMAGEAPRLTAAGKPQLRALWIPKAQVTVIDTWHVMGMRGTGSQDVAVEDVFVPAHLSTPSDAPPALTTPLYHPRAWQCVTWTVSAANALGIARGAIEALMALAGSEASTMNTQLLRDRPAVQARLGEAEAIVQAARAYVVAAIGRLWAVVSEGRDPGDAEIAQARLAITHAMHESVRAVDKLFHVAGTNAIYASLPLERAFRDLHVVVQHGAALPQYFESAGKVLLGLRPSDPGW